MLRLPRIVPEQRVPERIVLEILHFLKKGSVTKVRLVSKQWNLIVLTNMPELWRWRWPGQGVYTSDEESTDEEIRAEMRSEMALVVPRPGTSRAVVPQIRISPPSLDFDLLDRECPVCAIVCLCPDSY